MLISTFFETRLIVDCLSIILKAYSYGIRSGAFRDQNLGWNEGNIPLARLKNTKQHGGWNYPLPWLFNRKSFMYKN